MSLRVVKVAVIIPALNEERSLPLVLDALRQVQLGRVPGGGAIELSRVVVVDNGSTDRTGRVAAAAGASVISEPARGYGRACLKGIGHLESDPPDVVAFLDADFSDDPRSLPEIVRPIATGDADLVLGSRLMGGAEPGSLLPQARYGNMLAVVLIRTLYGYRYTDLGPFRAISYDKLLALGMRDKTYGWTVEMQVKALRSGLRVKEVSVPYRRRVGRSKISGTVSGTIKAGVLILWTIARHSLTDRFAAARGRSSAR